MSPISDARICEPFIRGRAVELLEHDHVVIFAGGTGNPFFTTDTCAALRAAEVGADVLLKATKVNGVFDSDPALNPGAKKYDRLTYEKILADRLGVMDLTAVELCKENKIPIVVFALSRPGNLIDAVRHRPTLRRLCGWETLKEVPSESTFSRVFAAFAEDQLPQRIQDAMIKKHYGDKIAGHISRDGTAGDGREKAAKKPPKA